MFGWCSFLLYTHALPLCLNLAWKNSQWDYIILYYLLHKTTKKFIIKQISMLTNLRILFWNACPGLSHSSSANTSVSNWMPLSSHSNSAAILSLLFPTRARSSFVHFNGFSEIFFFSLVLLALRSGLSRPLRGGFSSFVEVLNSSLERTSEDWLSEPKEL